jgi:hypothetical protein
VDVNSIEKHSSLARYSTNFGVQNFMAETAGVFVLSWGLHLGRLQPRFLILDKDGSD